MTTKNEIACKIADELLRRGAQGRAVPEAGTMGDLLRDYERAKYREDVEPADDDEPDEDAAASLAEELACLRVGHR